MAKWLTRRSAKPLCGGSTPPLASYGEKSPDGVIGSRAALKMLCRKACRFESDSGHNRKTIALGAIVFICHSEKTTGVSSWSFI